MSDIPGTSKESTRVRSARARKRLRSDEVDDILAHIDDEVDFDSDDGDDMDWEDLPSSSSSDEDSIQEMEVEASDEGVGPSTSSAPLHQLEDPSGEVPAANWSTDCSSLKEIRTTPPENRLLVSPPNSPIGYLDLFLNNDYLSKIVDCTNNYADKIKSMTQQSRARIFAWKPLTVEELKTFIGLIYHTGTAKMNRIVDYWKVHRLYKSVFPQYMSRNRFQLILRCLHFSDDVSNTNRMGKCQMCIDNFNSTMNSIYYPSKNLSLDESMVLWRGRLIFRQYIHKGKAPQVWN